MLSLPPTVRVYAATRPVDLRKGFDALAQLVRTRIAGDPLSGHLFLFFNRRADRAKVLFFTRTGYCLIYKRLEHGRFHLPQPTPGLERLELDGAELALLLEGIDLRTTRRVPTWAPIPATSASP